MKGRVDVSYNDAPLPPFQLLPNTQVEWGELSSVALSVRNSGVVNQASIDSQLIKMQSGGWPVKFTVSYSGRQPQRRVELKGITEDYIGHAQVREGGEVPGGLLEGWG